MRPAGSALARSEAVSESSVPGAPSNARVTWTLLPERRAADGRGERETAKLAGGPGALPVAELSGGLPAEQSEQVAPGIGTLAADAAIDGHGERIAPGVLPPGDRGVQLASDLRPVRRSAARAG